MNVSLRFVAGGLAFCFGLYFAARSLWWTTPPAQPWVMVASTALFLATLVLALWAGKDARMPRAVGVVVVVVSGVLPHSVSWALQESTREAPFATWFVGAAGLLAVVCIVRRRPLCGWLALALLTAGAMLWLGVADALRLGLVGSVVWVVAAQLLVRFWARAVADTERLAEIQQATSGWRATQLGRQRARRERVRYALAVAGPVLTAVIDQGGALDDDQRIDARVAEGRLRDEIRAASLLNDAVRDAIEQARRRGCAVTLFDEGDLDDLDGTQRSHIHDELATVLRSARSHRLIVRSSRDPQRAVTIVGRSGAGGRSDDDSVDLWHEISRSGPTASAAAGPVPPDRAA
ncbi:hypothetical protein [Microbacterium sp. YY-01]|uniref:hypothetical protein n=1 Tax=Microbacterium sp. YY-01 TaxID=3421634 RepID=UPI003D17A3F3